MRRDILVKVSEAYSQFSQFLQRERVSIFMHDSIECILKFVKMQKILWVYVEFYRTTSDEEEHRSTKFSLARNITKGKDNDGWEAIQQLSIGVDEIDSCFPGESQEYRDVVRDLVIISK